MTPHQHVRFPTGRLVHIAPTWPLSRWGYPTLCHRVMRFHRDRARATTEPVTCPECRRRGER